MKDKAYPRLKIKYVRPNIKKGKNNKKKHVPVKPSIMKGKNNKKNIYKYI